MQYLEKLIVPIGGLTLLSTASDYYVRSYYWGWDVQKQIELHGKDSIKCYLVDYSPISKPAAVTCTRPNPSWQTHSFFAPRNGAVVRGRECGTEHPNWVQLAPGDYVEKVVCGVEVLKEVDETKLPGPLLKNCQYFPELLENRGAIPSWSEASEKSKKLGEDTKFSGSLKN